MKCCHIKLKEAPDVVMPRRGPARIIVYDFTPHRRKRMFTLAGQYLGGALMAMLLYHGAVGLIPGDGGRILAMLAGTAAWLYVGVGLVSWTPWQIGCNLLTAVAVFALALASVVQASVFLSVVYGLHVLWSGVLPRFYHGYAPAWRRYLPVWIGVHCGLAVLLLLQ